MPHLGFAGRCFSCLQNAGRCRELLAEIGKGQGRRFTRRRVENAVERLEQRLSGPGAKRKDQVLTFEEMGVDFLSVNKTHMFRQLDFATKMSNVKGIRPEGSERARPHGPREGIGLVAG